MIFLFIKRFFIAAIATIAVVVVVVVVVTLYVQSATKIIVPRDKILRFECIHVKLNKS